MHFTMERLAHAYILLSSSADRLKQTAVHTAQWANCLSEDEEKRPCGLCASCIRIQHGVYRDCFLIEPQGASQTIQIEQIRRMQKDIAKKPQEGRLKVVIIQDAHRMNEQSQNCLLKTLEEPPDNTLLLLLADKTVGLLPTVLSRCQLITLENERGLPPLTDFELAADVLRDIISLGYEGIFDKAEFLEKSRKKNLADFFTTLEILFRDALLKASIQSGQSLDKLRQAPVDIGLLGSPLSFQKALEAVWYAAYLKERNVNTALILENLFLRLRKLDIQMN